MFKIKDAGRLLMQDWKNPRDLARELYAQIVSGSPAPATKPADSTSPVIAAAQSAERSGNSPRKTTLAERRGEPGRRGIQPKAPVAPQAKLGFVLPPAIKPTPAQARAGRQQAANARVAARQQLQVSAKLAATEARRPKGRATEVSQGRTSEVQVGPAPQANPAPTPIRSDATQQANPAPTRQATANPSRPGVSLPAQADSGRPLTFKPLADLTTELSILPSLTKIPRENAMDYWFGTVTGTSTPDYNGVPRYQVDISAFPNDDVEDNVAVTVWGIERTNQLDPGTILWPIFQCPVDGNFYCKPEVNERLARTTSVITARVKAVAGTGKAQIYTMTVPRGSTVGTFVSNIAGSTQVYSISGTPAGGDGTIPSGTWIIIRKIFNFWHIVAADCSGAP